MKAIISKQDPDTFLEPSAWKQKKHKGNFSVPLGSVTNGRLVFTRGASQITLSAKQALPSLFEAHFEGHVPQVRVQEGRVAVSYPHLSLLGWLIYHRRRPSAQIALNAAIPWHLDFQGGVSQLTADLTKADLRAIEMHGGASQATVTLPHPTETIPLRILGGASHVWLKRPLGTAVRVHLNGGVDQLTIDGRRFGATGNGLQWETEEYHHAVHRYSIEILGGASHIDVSNW